MSALKNGSELKMHYLKLLFFGPPRTGKSIARRRLLQEIKNIKSLKNPSVSSGIAVNSDIVITKMLASDHEIVTDPPHNSEPSVSTGTAKSSDTPIKRFSNQIVGVSRKNSKWLSLTKSKESEQQDTSEDNHYLTQLVYAYICKCESEKINAGERNVPTGVSTPVLNVSESVSNISEIESKETGDAVVMESKPPDSQTRSNSVTSTMQPESSEPLVTNSKPVEINHALEQLNSALESGSSDDLRKLIEDLMMLNMIDIGGQPAFLELCPAFTIGPALYFIFFRLDRDLKENQSIIFQAADGSIMYLESNYCTETVIYQILSSIACFGSQERPKSGNSVSSTKVCSHALLVGTHKDILKAKDKSIEQIDSKLRYLEETELYREKLLLKTYKDRKMFYSLNNMDGDDSEMSPIRDDIEEIIENYFTRVKIPASWLMFRIALQNLRKPVVTLSDCKEIAKGLKMEDTVQDAIWFFHHNVGNLMHYSGIKSINEIVICDPQVVFDSTSELIINTFKGRAVPETAKDNFINKGQFSLEHIKDRTEHHRKNQLSLTQLVDLLKNHNIIAEIKSNRDCSVENEPVFIMPAVLKEASEADLNKLMSSEMSTREVHPIMIYFVTGFVPFGVFCASVANLIARQGTLSPRWQLCDDQVMKNKVNFYIDESFVAILISRPQYLEIRVKQHEGTASDYTLKFICSTVRQTITQTLETVIAKMKHRPYIEVKSSLFTIDQTFDLAFMCCLCKGDSHGDHLMKVEKNYGKCLKKKLRVDLQKKHRIWFSEVSFIIY